MAVIIKYFKHAICSYTRYRNFSCPRKNEMVLSTRAFCDQQQQYTIEKSVNQVTLIGRVGIDPQLRGSDSNPVVVFTVATNTNYRYESGEVQQKTDWHRVSVFKPYLRNTVYQYMKKGSRVFLQGRILYGEVTDNKGISHVTTTIVADDVIFLGTSSKLEEKE